MFIRKKETVSAFDIEGSLVKLAQVSLNETPRLYRLATLKAKAETIEDLANVVRRLAADYKIAGTRIVVNLPRHKVTVKNIKLPSTSSAELEKMVTFQAAKQLPFSPEKIVSGFKVMGRDVNGYSDVMVALAHRDVVDRILKIFDKAGLEVERLLLSSEALGLLHTKREKEGEKASAVSLVDIGRSTVEVDVIREGRLCFTRSIIFPPFGDLSERIVDEIGKSLFTYGKTSADFKIRKVYLTGRQSILSREAPILKRTLEIPMVYVDALKVCRKEKDAALPDKERLKDDSFTAVLSLGFNSDEIEINLIPQEVRQKRMSRIVKESLAMSAALLLSVSIGVGGIAVKKFVDKKRYLASVNKGLNDAKPEVEKLSRFKDVSDLIKRHVKIKGSSIDVIRELYSKIPKEISLTILDYEDGHSCLLRGVSKKLSDVFKFISTLEGSPYFENVKVRYATKRVFKGRELTDFEISCALGQIE